MAMLLHVCLILALVAVTVSVVLYLRTRSLRHFEHAVQARLDGLRSAAELRELGYRTSQRLRDAALDEVGRMQGRRP